MQADDLSYLTTLQVPASARQIQVITQLSDCAQLPAPYYILGGGSNVLITRPLDGVLIHNQLKGIAVRHEGHHILLEVASGECWHELVDSCVNHHYYGIENLALIPGTVGGAVVQNIGAYGVELAELIVSVSAIDLRTGQQTTFSQSQCQFKYRSSFFKHPENRHWFISHVTLRLHKHASLRLSYPGLQEALSAQPSPCPRAVYEAVIAIRQQKLPDPKQLPNAGSFFKNPIVDQETVERLQAQYPRLPTFPAGSQYKIPAAWLIETCGWRGRVIDEVATYEKHALVIINPNRVSGQRVWQHAQRIQQAVFQQFAITLEPEVTIW